MAQNVLLFSLVAMYCTLSIAFAVSPLQDFCVADFNSSVIVNGRTCIDPKLVQADHFSFSGLHIPDNTPSRFGSQVNLINVGRLPGLNLSGIPRLLGLNTLGLSVARVDYVPGGIVPPHIHPRASEILTVIEGEFEAGFVTSNPDNRLIRKFLKKGDVFVFPIGLIHYQKNVGNGNAFTFSGYSSQNPGVIRVANALFGSNPSIPSDLLAKAFQIDQKVVDDLQVIF